MDIAVIILELCH